MLPPPPSSWIGILFSPAGSLSRGVFWRLLFITLLALLIGLLNRHGHHWARFPVALYEVSGAIIALTLSFRTNTAYNRFWEGRTLWGGVVNSCRNLQRGFVVHARLSEDEARTVSTWIVVFAHAMRRGLRSEEDFPEVERLLPPRDYEAFVEAPHRALYASSRISEFLLSLVEQGRINPMMQRHLEALNALGEQQQQSRAALIREAVAEYLVRHRRQDAEAAFGLWNGSAGDGLAYQEKVREEW